MDILEINEEEYNRAERRKRTLTPEEKIRRRKRRRRVRMLRAAAVGMTLLTAVCLIVGTVKLAGLLYERVMTGRKAEPVLSQSIEKADTGYKGKWKEFYAAELPRPELDVELLTVNEYSRPGIELPQVNNIFIHYTANAGTSALQNRSYFESLGETHERSASAHFIIDAGGDVVQCIPTKEIAYAVMKRNYDSLSIECCYVKENGEFTEATYQSLIRLTAWLLHKYKLEPQDVLRHYDEGGKNCPKYYVENEGVWEQFQLDLENYMENVV